MKCPVAVTLLLVSLTSWPVLSDRLPEQVKSSKYVERDEFTELYGTVDSLRTDLLETRNLLAQALLKLASPIDVDKTNSRDHDIFKRSALDESPGDHDESPADVDDLLSGLSIHSLLPLLSTRCKDGRDGKDGDDGEDGRDGRDGLNGVSGVNGNDGRDGLDGGPGLKGEPGVPGVEGPPGPPGNSTEGEPGQPGEEGPKGQTGARGLRGLAGPTGERGLKGSIGSRGSTGLGGSPGSAAQTRSVYTRWGRTSCAGGSSLIYQGFAAGTYYIKRGGGINYQCMPGRPEYNSYSSRGMASLLSGVEYQSDNIGLFPSNVQNHNVPCARCLSPRSAVMMYPAKRTCPTGWSKEYEGYLMSGWSERPNPTTFECVDASPQAISGSSSSTNGALFYFIKPDCSGEGTIGNCSYYSSSKQLTCVVCTK